MRERVHVQVHVTTRFQADCDNCGWHTREADQKHWVVRMVEQHKRVCPNPDPLRNGALMECGCWNYAPAGASVGFVEGCPVHGSVEAVTMNVPEPDGQSHGHLWTEPWPREEQ